MEAITSFNIMQYETWLDYVLPYLSRRHAGSYRVILHYYELFILYNLGLQFLNPMV